MVWLDGLGGLISINDADRSDHGTAKAYCSYCLDPLCLFLKSPASSVAILG